MIINRLVKMATYFLLCNSILSKIILYINSLYDVSFFITFIHGIFGFPLHFFFSTPPT